jgi:hypothetical protein
VGGVAFAKPPKLGLLAHLEMFVLAVDEVIEFGRLLLAFELHLADEQQMAGEDLVVGFLVFLL